MEKIKIDLGFATLVAEKGTDKIIMKFLLDWKTRPVVGSRI